MELNDENCTFHNLTAEEWAKNSQELQNELQLYKNMARVAGFLVLSWFFMFVIFSLPVKKRRRLFYGGVENPADIRKSEDPESMIEMPRPQNNASASNNASTSNNTRASNNAPASNNARTSNSSS